FFRAYTPASLRSCMLPGGGSFAVRPQHRDATRQWSGLRSPVVWVGGVDVPSELVDAHRAGHLVLFVGAGASRDAPSGLPDFQRLTEAIANEARYALSEGEILHP